PMYEWEKSLAMVPERPCHANWPLRGELARSRIACERCLEGIQRAKWWQACGSAADPGGCLARFTYMLLRQRPRQPILTRQIQDARRGPVGSLEHALPRGAGRALTAQHHRRRRLEQSLQRDQQ